MGDEEVILSIGETHLSATIEKDTIISRTINEIFPDYESVIPTDNNNNLTVDKKILLGAIKRVSIFSNKSTHQVAFNILKGQFFITTEDPESSSKAKEEIIAEYEGEDLVIGYNGEYLKDVINHTTGDEVTIKLNTPISATLFAGLNKNEDKIMLLMPVRINSWNKKTPMEISSINMISFRNHERKSMSFGPGITIIWGENGSGKTSLIFSLVSISSVSFCKLFKNSFDISLIFMADEESITKFSPKNSIVPSWTKNSSKFPSFF